MIELQEHLLTDGAGISHGVPAELRGTGHEPSLRGGNGDPVADEVALKLAGDAVDGVTFWHLRSPAGDVFPGDGSVTFVLAELMNAAHMPLLIAERLGDERVDETGGLRYRVLAGTD